MRSGGPGLRRRNTSVRNEPCETGRAKIISRSPRRARVSRLHAAGPCVELLPPNRGPATSTARAAASTAAYVVVSVAPDGWGTVADNHGSTCGQASRNGAGQCTFSYPAAAGATGFDQNVTFTAAAGPGETFSGWKAAGADSTT